MRNFLIDYGMTNREAINLTTSEYYKRLELVSKFGIAITGSEDIGLEDWEQWIEKQSKKFYNLQIVILSITNQIPHILKSALIIHSITNRKNQRINIITKNFFSLLL